MSTTNATQSVPGMNYPTQKAMLAGNPRDSAMQQMTNTNIKQASLNAAVGGKRSKRRGGASNSTIPVPQYQMQYTPQGGPGTDPNAQIQQNLANVQCRCGTQIAILRAVIKARENITITKA
jgi:hypothetical protein